METPKVAIFIQARTNSTRLPGKIYSGLPTQTDPALLEHIYRRLSHCLNPVILIPETDHQLQNWCQTRNLNIFTGPETDVRARFRQAARHFNADIIVRATGDNPCVDPDIAAQTIHEIQNRRADLVSFSNLPLGIAVEALHSRALFSDHFPPQPPHREHVSLHIKHNPQHFNIQHLPHPLMQDFPAPPPRLTVDTPADLTVIRRIYQKLGPDFKTRAILELRRQEPDLFSDNQHVQQLTFAQNACNPS